MESKLEGLERKTVEFIICLIVQFSPIAFREVCHFHSQFTNGMVGDQSVSDY